MSGPAFVQVLFAVLLVVTAVAKGVSLPAFRQTLLELGFRGWMARVGAYLMPIAELLTAALLLWEPWRLWGEAAVLLLVIAFSWATYRALSQEQRVDCNCFGALLPEVFGWTTIGRIGAVTLLDAYLFYSVAPTGLQAANLEAWIGALTLSAGLIVLYALGSAFLGSQTAPRRAPKEQ